MAADSHNSANAKEKGKKKIAATGKSVIDLNSDYILWT